LKAKRGIQGYATLVRLLEKHPMTRPDLAAVSEFSSRQLGRQLRCMHEASLIRIAGWQNCNRRGPLLVVWGAGDEPDVPYPGGKCKNRTPRSQPLRAVAPRRGPEMMVFVNMLDALREGASSVELVELVGSARGTVHAFVKHCRRIGLIHIHAWHGTTPIYKLGHRTDAAKRKPQTVAQINARWDMKRREARRFASLQQAFA
jgi:hypothetical protein